MSEKQTYESYYKAYFKSPAGRMARSKAQRKYRARLRQEALKTPQKLTKEQ